MEKDTALAVFQAAIALASVLLIFVGFIAARAESFSSSLRKERMLSLAF
jgi:hypothetical protein